jgi:hypothetical protein
LLPLTFLSFLGASIEIEFCSPAFLDFVNESDPVIVASNGSFVAVRTDYDQLAINSLSHRKYCEVLHVGNTSTILFSGD